MNIILRNWHKLAAALIAAGAVLFAVGWGIGGLSQGNIYIDANGLHVPRKNAAVNDFVIDKTNIADFTNVVISTASTDIIFVESDGFALEAHMPPGSKPDWSVDNGTLTFKTNPGAWSINLFGFNFTNRDYVKIYYPKDAKFGDMTLSTGSGDVTVPDVSLNTAKISSASGDIAFGDSSAVSTASSSDVTSVTGADGTSYLLSISVAEDGPKSLYIKTASGNINASASGHGSVELRSASGNITAFGGDGAALTLNTASGDINAKDGIWSGITASSASGNIKISGTAQGQTSVKSTSGDVTLALTGALTQYSYELSSVSGGISVNGRKAGSPARSDQSNAGNAVTAHTTSGNIKLNFTQ